MTSLSTHVLDLAHGRPAGGVSVRLLQDDAVLATGVTDADGRWPGLAATRVGSGRYALEFAVADYFRAAGVTLADPPFLDTVTIAFGLAADGGHHHVPLLVSPYGYSSYRGS